MQTAFLNMIQDFEFEGFDACWQAFETKYPNSNFPKNYAQQIWQEETA